MNLLSSKTLAILLCLLITGCFRYTPSRSELESEGESQVAGADAFESYQTRLRNRLSTLVAERAALVGPHSEQSYRIGASDVLKIDVFGFSELSGEMEVNENGMITLPLVGAIQAATRTVAELNTDLTAQYARFVRNPKVRLTVDRYNAHRVSVVGSVVKPGFYPLKNSGYLLTELLAEVGGTKDNAGNRLYLIPARSGQPSGIAPSAAEATTAAPTTTEPAPVVGANGGAGVEIDLEELTGTLERAPLLIPLLPGDTIIVPEAGQFRVDGEVERPGSFPVSRRTSSLSAIAAAGGFTYAANVNEVEVIRDIGGGQKAALTVDLEKIAFHGMQDISLRDGDVVIVPSAAGRFRARQVVETFRSIMRGGVTGSIRYQ